MAKKFRDLVAAIDRDPEARARVEEYKRAMEDAIMLAERREPNGVAREEKTAPPSTMRATVSPIGPEHGPYLSALEDYVADLGGHLEVRAVFPDGTILVLCGRNESGDGGS
jgi:hypothetical protein